MKKNIIIIFQSLLFVFLLSLSSFAQSTLEQLETIEGEIANLLLQQTGDEYFVSAYNKNFNPVLDFGFESQGNIFEQGALFTTWGPINKDSFDRYAFVGIFENGTIKWQSEKEIPLSTAVDTEVLGVLDLNNDGKVEIITQWEYGMRGGNTDLWIYTWDGTSGERINYVRKDGKSAVQATKASVEIVDVEPDGIKEILGKDREATLNVYSWNGQEYGDWGMSLPRQLPRNAVEVDVGTRIKQAEEPTDLLTFQYNISNRTGSLQSTEEFAVKNFSIAPKNANKPDNWRFNPHVKYRLVSWQVKNFLEQHPEALLEPGESDSSFSFTTTGLPRPATYYVKGNNGDLSFDTDDLVNNSVSGITLGPYNPPENASTFTDSLSSYTTRACELQWITNKGICNSLESKLKNISQHLDKEKPKQAGNVLGAFINEVEAQKNKYLTSEGYGLLYFNAVYLREKLDTKN